MAERPLVETRVMTEFGEVITSPEFYDADGQDQDLTYTPGWSEMRRARDVAVAEARHGKRATKDIPTLPVRVFLARRTNVAGVPDSRKVIQASNDGYRAVTKEDIGAPWFTFLPPGAAILADGTIAKGDVTYMVTDAKNAARNQALAHARTAKMLESAGQSLLETGRSARGSEPWIESEPADHKIKYDGASKSASLA